MAEPKPAAAERTAVPPPAPCVPGSARLLDVWEAASGRSAAQQAILLLAAAYPDVPAGELWRLAIGERDARLLLLRDRLFGPELTCVAGCPQCAEKLELSFQVGDVLMPGAADPAPLVLTGDGYEVTARLPDSTDLEALAGVGDPVAVLLGRCVTDARRRGRKCPPGRLPVGIVAAIAERMSEADPQADLQLALSCAGCGHRWLAPFDIAGYLWQELDAWAGRVLDDVHRLARAYGWREADVLALGSRRRRHYLDRVGG